jgi:adenylate cyclase
MNAPSGIGTLASQRREVLPANAGSELFVVVREHKSEGRPIAEGNLVDWLLDLDNRSKDGIVLFDELCWRLLGQGIPLWRANLSIGTLHPQIMGIGYRWYRDRALAQEFRVRHGMTEQSDYLESPMRPALERGIPMRYRLDGSERHEQYPLLQTFREQGATDYLVLPLTLFVGRHSVVTWATDRPGGFTDGHVAAIQAILPALGLVVESKAMQRISTVLLDTYLGSTISRHILAGEVTRGQGRRVRAALMATDMRGFTALSDRLPGTELIMMLDDYFDAVTASVHAEGGEILKFIGDGVLAIFVPDGRSEQDVAAAALSAGQESLRRIGLVNDNRFAVGQDLIRVGIGLHLGEVIYGNVGASDRLDFTAIGPAVNLVSRLESLTKRLERPLLLSEAFAEAVGGGLLSLGFHPVKGLSEPQEVFAPATGA